MPTLLLRYADLIIVGVAAPPLLALGVPVLGYAVGASTWLLLRCLGMAVDHQASAQEPGGSNLAQLTRQLSLTLGYRFARIVGLATASIIVVKQAGRSNGLTTVLVMAVAFALQQTVAAVGRFSRRRAPGGPRRESDAGPAQRRSAQSRAASPPVP
jgi:hypothetical protein